MKEIKKTIAAALVALAVLMAGTGVIYAMNKQLYRTALAKLVESFPDHSRIPTSNPKSKLP